MRKWWKEPWLLLRIVVDCCCNCLGTNVCCFCNPLLGKLVAWGENSRFYHAFKQEDFVGKLSTLAAQCKKPKLEDALLPRFFLGFLGFSQGFQGFSWCFQAARAEMISRGQGVLKNSYESWKSGCVKPWWGCISTMNSWRWTRLAAVWRSCGPSEKMEMQPGVRDYPSTCWEGCWHRMHAQHIIEIGQHAQQPIEMHRDIYMQIILYWGIFARNSIL